MKKIKYILFAFFLLLNIECVLAFDTSSKVYDYAQVLSESEESKLKEEALSFINNYNMDMVIVTVRYHSKNSTEAYAQDFYDYNGFGLGSTRDGIIAVIDFTYGTTDFYITTTGEAIRIYDDARIDGMLDAMDEIYYSNNKDYYNMFKAFIRSASSYASQGVPSSNSGTYIDSNGDLRYKPSMPWGKIALISLALPTIVVVILISKNKMVKAASNANNYLKDDTVNINVRSDQFLTTHTTTTRIDSDSGGSSGRIGGSSISRGSSGISHGGGGRRH